MRRLQPEPLPPPADATTLRCAMYLPFFLRRPFALAVADEVFSVSVEIASCFLFLSVAFVLSVLRFFHPEHILRDERAATVSRRRSVSRGIKGFVLLPLRGGRSEDGGRGTRFE